MTGKDRKRQVGTEQDETWQDRLRRAHRGELDRTTLPVYRYEGKQHSLSVGDLERVTLLLQCGCNPDAADYDRRTCLHLACSVGNLRVVQALLDVNVDINFKDRWGGPGLADAVREGHRDIAHLLVNAGAVLDYDEETASGSLCELARVGEVLRARGWR